MYMFGAGLSDHKSSQVVKLMKNKIAAHWNGCLRMSYIRLVCGIDAFVNINQIIHFIGLYRRTRAHKMSL